MKKSTRFNLISATSLLFCILLVILIYIEREANLREPVDYKSIEKEISLELMKYPPESDHARRLARLYERVHSKRSGKKIRTETPGAFLSALREIKIAYDGTEYESNYRTKELEKARRNKLLRKNSSADENLNWNERGPGNCSGRSQQLVVDPSDTTHATWFAATIGGGVWKTSNSGQNWTNCTPDLSTLSTSTIDICKSNPNVLYVGTGMGFGRVIDLAGSGIWKSTDHGDTWFQLQSTANNELYAAINRLVVCPDDENLVIACSNNDYTSYGPNGGSRESGIFRTTDGGISWTKVFDPEQVFGSNTDNRVQHIVANPENFNILYASVNEVGVVKSTDAGLTWSVSANNFADPEHIGDFEGSYQGISCRIELAISPSDPNRVYAAVERTRGVAQLFMTKNAGETWANVRDVGDNPNWFAGGPSGATGVYTSGWFANTIAVSPYDENLLYVGGVLLYRIKVNPVANTRLTTSMDSNNAGLHPDLHDIDIIPINEANNSYDMIICNDNGVARSTNKGESWVGSPGLNSSQFYGVDKAPGINRYIGGTQDNGTWVSGSYPHANSNWSHVIGGDGFEVVWNYHNSDLLMGGYQFGNLERSTDGGRSWLLCHLGGSGFESAPFITKIASSKLNPDLVFTIMPGILKRSEDFGATWSTVVPGTNWTGIRAFDNVEISLADPQVVWITSPLDNKPWIGQRGGIHISTDGGLSFSEISQNFPNTVVESSGFATHPFDPNTAFALFSATGTPKILKTTNLGQSWTDISGFSLPAGRLNKSNVSENESLNGYPDVATYCLLVMPYDENILWAGTEIGLFISQDGGVSWNYSDNGLPQVGIFQMLIQDGQVILATYGRGIWTVNIPELNSYELPEVTIAPRINSFYQSTSGDAVLIYALRSAYDSTKIFLNGGIIETFTTNENSVVDTLSIPVFADTQFSMQIFSYKDGHEYRSSLQELAVSSASARYVYTNNFDSQETFTDFTEKGLSIKSYEGFSNNAIHSGHPYEDVGNFICQLNIPIIVASGNATISYDDVALIEIGLNSDYTDPLFFDYVILEATPDGKNWIPLLDGYDSSYDPVWLETYNSRFSDYNSTAPGDESLFRNHSVNLLDFFNPGDRIFIRFRLYADISSHSWGWAIDNLQIQPDASDKEHEMPVPENYALYQNYPNPFNPSTTIQYNIPENSRVNINIYNSLGELVEKLKDEVQNAGEYLVKWNATNYSSGVYYGRIEAIGREEKYKKTIKMLLIK